MSNQDRKGFLKDSWLVVSCDIDIKLAWIKGDRAATWKSPLYCLKTPTEIWTSNFWYSTHFSNWYPRTIQLLHQVDFKLLLLTFTSFELYPIFNFNFNLVYTCDTRREQLIYLFACYCYIKFNESRAEKNHQYLKPRPLHDESGMLTITPNQQIRN